MRGLLLFLFLILILLLAGAPAFAQSPTITLVRVEKSARTLSLLHGDSVVQRFPIRLGGAPIGHKQREGDRRTPEGRYMLDYRNPNSAFFRSIHISYPNARDRANARRLGVSPGGAIMIHGQPNGLPGPVSAAIPYDWTDGCIALSNDDMATLWSLLRLPTPIEILP